MTQSQFEYSSSSDSLGTVQIGDIELCYRDADGGGRHYQGRGHYEEYVSPLYRLLREELSPKACIDIGANYGYTGLLMRKAFPEAELTLVEPIPWLESFIRQNFKHNDALFDKFYSAIASDAVSKSQFGVNRNSSQDSRVKPLKGWDIVETTSVTIDDLAANVAPDQGVYIKIDTQGWEEHVLRGGKNFFAHHNRWFVKTEFAPKWMESQNSDPVSVLRSWVDQYDVFESAGRVAWNCSTLSNCLGTKIEPGDIQEFVDYVTSLNRDRLGWVDLFILPKRSRRQYGARSVDAGTGTYSRKANPLGSFLRGGRSLFDFLGRS